jgi:hypothetical protein
MLINFKNNYLNAIIKAIFKGKIPYKYNKRLKSLIAFKILLNYL